MITAIHGPLIVEPDVWTLVFKRTSSTWWVRMLARGRYKHVCAYAYVPFLHVWVFFDPSISGTRFTVAADGDPAKALIREWMIDADLMRISRRAGVGPVSVFGFCVPAIKALIGLRCGALRPDALWQHCLEHGGQPFEGIYGRSDEDAEIRSAAA